MAPYKVRRGPLVWAHVGNESTYRVERAAELAN